MAPADRWQYVRGLLCWGCNGFRLARGATVANLRGAADYLEAYESRKLKREAGLEDIPDSIVLHKMTAEEREALT